MSRKLSMLGGDRSLGVPQGGICSVALNEEGIRILERWITQRYDAVLVPVLNPLRRLDGKYVVDIPRWMRDELDSIVVKNKVDFSTAMKIFVAVKRLAPALLLFLLGACSVSAPTEPPPVQAALDTVPWSLALDSLPVYVP